MTPVLCRALCTVQWPTRTPATSVSALRAPRLQPARCKPQFTNGGHGRLPFFGWAWYNGGKGRLETKNKNEGDDRRAHPLTGSPKSCKTRSCRMAARSRVCATVLRFSRLRRRQMRPGRPLPAAQRARWYGADPDKVYMGNPHLDDGQPRDRLTTALPGRSSRPPAPTWPRTAAGYTPQDLTGAEEADLVAQL